MSSASPDHGGSRASYTSPESGDASKGDSSQPSLEFLRSLAEKRNVRGDGSQPKRRGPKPDSKPALTRRQELNRQAQRTHRERKELYIKALEDEVLRLKQVYGNVSQDKAELADENQQLKDLLAQHGILVPDAPKQPHSRTFGAGNPAPGQSRTSVGVSSPDRASQSSASFVASSARQPPMSGLQLRGLTQQALQNKGIDYEQAGIDFVLTLERPCMSHLPYLVDVKRAQGGLSCGHALMASCPPQSFNSLPADGIFNQSHSHGGDGQCQATWALSKADLSTLLDLSAKLDLDGQLTPITAWGLLMAHPRLQELSPRDFQSMAEILQSKVRCYGFGAVTEEFEVRDALESILANKPHRAMAITM